jgi:hypothetical protein
VTCTYYPVIITAGHEAAWGEGGLHLPRKELVGVLQVLLQTRRLHIPRTLSEASLLVRELENFKAKVTLAGGDTMEAWREGEHDDLVLAVALAAWVGEQALPPLEEPPEDTVITRLVPVWPAQPLLADHVPAGSQRPPRPLAVVVVSILTTGCRRGSLRAPRGGSATSVLACDRRATFRRVCRPGSPSASRP